MDYDILVSLRGTGIVSSSGKTAEDLSKEFLDTIEEEIRLQKEKNEKVQSQISDFSKNLEDERVIRENQTTFRLIENSLSKQRLTLSLKNLEEKMGTKFDSLRQQLEEVNV